MNEVELPQPQVMLFDWHGTLVDTLDAMYKTMDDMLPQLEELDLVQRLTPEDACTDPDDVKLVRYIRIFRRLHPRILAERRVSRTEIFNAIFATDLEARQIAHDAYNACYRNHYGDVIPFQRGIQDYLKTFRALGIKLGIATNRSREFLEHELQQVDDGRWQGLFDVIVCADDVSHYKPEPDVIHKALQHLNIPVSRAVWYVGDSQTDMQTAINAGVTPIYFNGAHWEERWIDRIMASKGSGADAPSAVVNGFEQLMDILAEIEKQDKVDFAVSLQEHRPPAYPPRDPPPPRIEPDWHPSFVRLTAPAVILFDWHATLVDTLDAMYHAVDEMLPELESLGLIERLIPPSQSKSTEDARLVEYVRSYRQLHPKIKTDRKISRTDIFEVLFGDDQRAKHIAHKAFNRHYREHFGTVLPFEPQVRLLLQGLKALGITLGMITNRDREFFEQELVAVEEGSWAGLFDIEICGDDTLRRKPHPDQLEKAMENLSVKPSAAVWYVGDSTTDTIAAKTAGITSVFFNGAQWDLPWLQKIFPGNERYPYKPDVVINDFSEFWALVLACRG